MPNLPTTIFVDRDGVINQDSDDFIKSIDEWQALPGSIEALSELSKNGYQVIVITNQSGIGRGLFSLDELEAMHNKLKKLVAQHGGHITDIFYCPHHPDEDCDCRKPKPGLIIQAQKKYHIDFKNSWSVGDSYRDIEAGLAAGTQVALVRSGKGERTLAKYPKLPETVSVFADLQAFTQWILQKDK